MANLNSKGLYRGLQEVRAYFQFGGPLWLLLGYLAAAGIAGLAVWINAAPSAQQQASSGMSAFGDSLLFLAAFTIATLPISAAGFRRYRYRPAFWRGFAGLALAVGLSAPFSVLIALAIANPAQESWALIAVLRLVLTPPLILNELLAALMAPPRSPRVLMLGAVVLEVLGLACFVRFWMFPA